MSVPTGRLLQHYPSLYCQTWMPWLFSFSVTDDFYSTVILGRSFQITGHGGWQPIAFVQLAQGLCRQSTGLVQLAAFFVKVLLEHSCALLLPKAICYYLRMAELSMVHTAHKTKNIYSPAFKSKRLRFPSLTNRAHSFYTWRRGSPMGHRDSVTVTWPTYAYIFCLVVFSFLPQYPREWTRAVVT